jgi:hypothetical protein
MRVTDEQVEAAAMAIREVFGNRSGRGAPWHNLPERIRQEYRNEARAALTAAAAVGWTIIELNAALDDICYRRSHGRTAALDAEFAALQIALAIACATEAGNTVSEQRERR